MVLKTCIENLLRGENLSACLCQQAMEEILARDINPLQIAAFLVLLRAKGETADEITAIVKVLRNKMMVVPTQFPVLDIVGTGGDGFNTVNISTGSAMLAASCGIKVAKHGNRSVSSLSGSADVLEALGIHIDLTPEQVGKSIDEIGIGFCYSPNFHPVTQKLRDVRQKLNVATVFNLLGPLLNPAQASHLVLGVAHESLLSTIAAVLIAMGQERAVVVHSMGLDEVSCVGISKIIEINQGQINEYSLDPAELGFNYCQLIDLQGGDAKTNAQLLLDAFHGKRCAIADTLILNAAIALYIYGRYSSVAEALAHARNNLYEGAVIQLLHQWIQFSHDQ